MLQWSQAAPALNGSTVVLPHDIEASSSRALPLSLLVGAGVGVGLACRAMSGIEGAGSPKAVLSIVSREN